jgi:hypothetical protein
LAELHRRRRLADRLDDAVGGTEHNVGTRRRKALRVAEEIHAPRRRHRADPSQRPINDAERHGGNGEQADERPTLAMDRDEDGLQHIGDHIGPRRAVSFGHLHHESLRCPGLAGRRGQNQSPFSSRRTITLLTGGNVFK